MKPEVRTMLEELYDIFKVKFHDPIKSWDKMLEFITSDHCGPLLLQLSHKFEWLFKDKSLVKDIETTYDFNLLKSDYYDHLGEMYLEKIVSKSKTKSKEQYATSLQIADLMGEMASLPNYSSYNVLDSDVGTGKLLMAVHQLAPAAQLFGAGTDLRALRVAITNFAIHNISGYLLHADDLKHELDIALPEGKYNWGYANRWHSYMDRLDLKVRDLDHRRQLKLWNKQR